MPLPPLLLLLVAHTRYSANATCTTAHGGAPRALFGGLFCGHTRLDKNVSERLREREKKHTEAKDTHREREKNERPTNTRTA